MSRYATKSPNHLTRHLFDLAMSSGLVYAGVDEVGRGCLAGPVVAAAVIPPMDVHSWVDVDDSKRLKQSKRQELAKRILDTAIAVGVGSATVEEIDQFNILRATKLAMKRAVAKLSFVPEILMVDGNQSAESDIPSLPVINGDARSLSIAAASIVAKVNRDKWMQQLHEEYPNYGFFQNVGYGTPAHIQALRSFGPTPYHRASFAPVREARITQMRLPLHG